jgi:hypothetical protein
MLVLIAEPGCCGPFVLEGSVLMGAGCPAEGADAGGNRPLCGGLGGGQMALRRGEPLPGLGRARIAMAPGLQLADPRVDGINALPRRLPATLRGLPLVVHASSMPRLGQSGSRLGRGPVLWPDRHHPVREAGRRALPIAGTMMRAADILDGLGPAHGPTSASMRRSPW